MYLTKEIKEEIRKHGENKHRKIRSSNCFVHFQNCHLTEHLKKNRHDYNTERSLVLLVEKKIFVGLLEKKEINRYREIIKVLGIRK
jgi:small subunit ribosomal protein S15